MMCPIIFSIAAYQYVGQAYLFVYLVIFIRLKIFTDYNQDGNSVLFLN